MTTPDEFRALLEMPEGSRVEFKAAEGSYEFDELVKYCVALANEGGGRIVLGATDKRPRRVIGTKAFREPGRTEAGLFERLGRKIEIEEYQHEGKRVLIIHVPSRPPGTAWADRGTFWMRAGDAVVPMSDERLRQIHTERAPDFSAEVCPEARLSDIDPEALQLFRSLWDRKAPGQGVAERRDFRRGFLPVLNEVWQAINLRNEIQHFQQGLFVWDIPTFDESAVREALLNAVSHREYRQGGSVVVRQYPRRIEVVSPGGFPPGVTVENALWEQNPRNRRIAKALGRCGLVERAGQGFDLMYRTCIQQGKRLPDLSRTTEYRVWVTLHGQIQDPEFLRFLEEIGGERLATFGTEDFVVLDSVRREQPMPEILKRRVGPLLEAGVIEKVGRGRGVRYLLSRRFYRYLGKPGGYTRKRGLDPEQSKALLEKHLRDTSPAGCAMAGFQQVVPELSRAMIKRPLDELRREGRVQLSGRRRWTHWSVVVDGAKSPGSTQPERPEP